MNAQSRDARIKGLTIVEIMVVVSILSLLAGLILIVTAAVNDRGRFLTCRTNLHQIALAFEEFRLKNRRMPNMGIDDEGWIRALSPLLASKNLYICPSDYALWGNNEGRVLSLPDDLGLPRYRTTSYTCFLKNRRERFQNGAMVWYEETWHEVFNRRGALTPIVECRHHAAGRLFARMNGSVELAKKTAEPWYAQ